MELIQTPASRFVGLPDYPFAENYLEIPFEGHRLSMHYLDEGGPSEETVVLMHGQPSWSFLYRKMIPALVAAGHRMIAPDLIGFGKSDKPTRIQDYTYARQVQWLRAALLDQLDLSNITLFAHDWGGLLSLPIVARDPDRFARVMVSNTGLPTGDENSNFLPGDGPRKRLVSFGTRTWQLYARFSPRFAIGSFVQWALTHSSLPEKVIAGYDAPFPTNDHKAGPRAMPQRIPMQPNSPGSAESREAWRLLADFDKPFRTAFSDRDATMSTGPRLGISRPDKSFQKHVPGAADQRHVVISDAAHFLQEDNAEAVARELNAFIEENPR